MRRLAFIPRSVWVQDHLGAWSDHIMGKLNCATGRHRVKFSSFPYCIRCGKDPRQYR